VTVRAARTPLAVLLELMAIFAAVALFVGAFGQGDGPAPSFIAVAVVLVGSFVLARALQLVDIEESTMRWAGVIVSLLALFILVRLEYAPDEWLLDTGWLASFFSDTADTIQPNGHVIAGMIALLPVWFRGVWRGVAPLEFDGVLTSASLGMFAVLIAALATPDTRETISWGAFAFAYAALGLVTLALFQAPEPQLPLAIFARRWTVALAAIGGAAVGVALVAAAIDPDAFGFLAPIGEPLRVAAELLGTFVLSPILYVLSLPFRFFWWLVGQLVPENDDLIPPAPEETPLEREEPDEDRERPVWQQILVWAMFIGGAIPLVAVALVVLWYAFRRFARKREDERERREDIEPASTLLGDLGDMIGALARRFRRGPRPQSAVQIRRLYFEMLDAAAARGLERPSAATPLQFAPALDAHFASAVPSSISRAFAASRYGEVPIDPAEVGQLRTSWDRIHRGDAETRSS
jgi:hypothetical protein